MAAPPEKEYSCKNITASLAPDLRTIIFDKVGIVPFQAEDTELGATLTSSFNSALANTKKYKILPLEVIAGQHFLSDLKEQSLKQRVISLGRSLKIRGIISATITQTRAVALEDRKPLSALSINIQMTDTQTGKKAWSLKMECSAQATDQHLPPAQAQQIMDRGLQVLISEMVKAGDIFSPLLPRPTVISSRGDLRKIRVVLQPDPLYLFSRYQLLIADNPRGVFIPHSSPVQNDQAPIILEEKNLLDSTRYYCTVIGITPAGLANIPAHPFAITTSGAPRPLPYLQVSGNNLRHIQLQWSPSQDPHVTGYIIYRSTTPQGPFKKIADVDGRNRQSFTDYGEVRRNTYGNLADDTQYFYTIRTRNTFDVESKGAPIVSAHTKGAPLPPAELQAIGNQPRQVSLFWQPSQDPDIKGYAIFRKEQSQNIFSQIDFVNGRDSQKYTDTGSWTTSLKNNCTYFYQLRSVNVVDISSTSSQTVSATTKPAPVAVRGLQASNNTFRQVQLQWQPNPENDITGYEIFRGQTKDDLRKIDKTAADITSYDDKGLWDGMIYWYQVRAIDIDQLQGDFSPARRATTKARPLPPRALVARKIPQGIRLDWQPGKGSDIDHYEIYSPGFLATKLGNAQDNFFIYQVKTTPGKTYDFQVKAVNRDGLTSDLSEQISLRIPVTTDSREKK